MFLPGSTLERIADVCVSQALDGDEDARKEIAERHDGRVPQPIVGDDDEPPSTCNRRSRSSLSDQIKVAEVFLPLMSPARFKGAWGGRGSGKSHFFGELLVDECVGTPGTRAILL